MEASDVLVTGAGGFLGQPLVRALLARGHRVRALTLPGPGLELGQATVIAEDLCTSPDLARHCAGVGTVVHLAARMQGSDAEIVQETVTGTERLLAAMAAAHVPRLVLASSLSVYDWSRAQGTLVEDSQLEAHSETRDGYTVAKLRQEALARAAGLRLTVVRPGIIWGRGREYPPTIGQQAGPLRVVIAPDRQLLGVHVDNCADAFATLVDGNHVGTFNLIDHPEVTVGQFVADHFQRTGRHGFVLPAPFGPSVSTLGLLQRLTPAGVARRLPSFLAPRRFEARYKPVQIEGRRLRENVGWQPLFSYSECLERTYPKHQGAS
jgi:nucleoside-diphosphate-sugar epimerase